MRFFYCVAILLFTSVLFSQKTLYPFSQIPDSLKQNANAVVRLDQSDITISSQRSMTIKTLRIVTVLNEQGVSEIDAVAHYDKSTSVREIQATVYDASGNEIKKIRRKDFRDQSVIDGITIFSDSRFLYLDYTPVQYPFTIVFELETSTSNTAFIPTWMPLDSYFVSVEKSVINLNYPAALGFKKKENHFEGFQIAKTTDSATSLSYTASNITARRYEDQSLTFSDIFPKLQLGLEVFHLEGVDGSAKNWKEFGQWYSDKVLSGTIEISEATKLKMKNLVGNEKDPIKKARIIYDYVQKKSRYVSIQVGIGGWKPMLASDVDRLGYGDCKALSNYTRALLSAVDVSSYNTVLFGDSRKRDIDGDFVSLQGNHMILSVPDGDNYVWLECTSQDNPFGYQANFTDDRDVLVMKPEGGEIVHTKSYINKENAQFSKSSYLLSETGNMSCITAIVSQGSQYGNKYRLEYDSPVDRDEHYKKYWAGINNLKIKKTQFFNDKDQIKFTENIELDAVNYGNLSGGKMMFAVNPLNQISGNIKRIRNRKTPFEISRGYFDEDEISITLPIGYQIESMPENFEISGKFGDYKTELIRKEDNKLTYNRIAYIKKGTYAGNEYEEYRLFMEKIARNDNAKIILVKNK